MDSILGGLIYSILGGLILLLQVAAGFPVFLLVYYTFDFVENRLTELGQTKSVIILFQGILFVNVGCPLVDFLDKLLATDKLFTLLFLFSFLLKFLAFFKFITLNIN